MGFFVVVLFFFFLPSQSISRGLLLHQDILTNDTSAWDYLFNLPSNTADIFLHQA